MSFLDDIKKKAKKNLRKIAFPESDDERILEAVSIVSRERIARCVLIGNPEIVLSSLKRYNTDLKFVEIADSKKEDNVDFAVSLLKKGEVDGVLSGAKHTTSETLMSIFKILKPKGRVSGMFFIIKKKNMFLFADSAVNIDPNDEQLAEIAIQTADSASFFGIEPRVAMLSFSTKGSAKHAFVDKVRRATLIVKKKKPDLIIDGEVQVDAAVDAAVCKKKCPNCATSGNANVLIFPDLNSGNIAYKLVEKLGDAVAIGPIMQGLDKPVNDLSRGCSSDDIVNITAITSVQAQNGL